MGRPRGEAAFPQDGSWTHSAWHGIISLSLLFYDGTHRHSQRQSHQQYRPSFPSFQPRASAEARLRRNPAVMLHRGAPGLTCTGGEVVQPSDPPARHICHQQRAAGSCECQTLIQDQEAGFCRSHCSGLLCSKHSKALEILSASSNQ